MDRLDMIVRAQREAAIATGCPFWIYGARWAARARMAKWFTAGMAQADRVHFTTPGYHLLGDAVFADVMSQYDLFLRLARRLWPRQVRRVRWGTNGFRDSGVLLSVLHEGGGRSVGMWRFALPSLPAVWHAARTGGRARYRLAAILMGAILLASCESKPPQQAASGYGYVGPATLNLRKDLGPRASNVGRWGMANDWKSWRCGAGSSGCGRRGGRGVD